MDLISMSISLLFLEIQIINNFFWDQWNTTYVLMFDDSISQHEVYCEIIVDFNEHNTLNIFIRHLIYIWKLYLFDLLASMIYTLDIYHDAELSLYKTNVNSCLKHSI